LEVDPTSLLRTVDLGLGTAEVGGLDAQGPHFWFADDSDFMEDADVDGSERGDDPGG
jgi:hypothetical protein